MIGFSFNISNPVVCRRSEAAFRAEAASNNRANVRNEERLISAEETSQEHLNVGSEPSTTSLKLEGRWRASSSGKDRGRGSVVAQSLGEIKVG